MKDNEVEAKRVYRNLEKKTEKKVREGVVREILLLERLERLRNILN